ncbi:MAG: TIR domain-containing protein [Pyrinomonadaceae bacterium]
MPLSLLSGDDVFISYSRKDGALYAAGLADKLTEKGLSCFIDKLGTEPSHDLPDSLRKKIRSCTVFVLVGTQMAARSEFVEKEIAEFKQTGRTILPLDFGGAVGGARWYGLIPGLATESEQNPAALGTGNPSPNVLSFIEKSFRYTRRNQRMFRMFLGALTVFLLLAAVSLVAFYIAQDQVGKATAAIMTAADEEKKAKEATDLAERKTKEAQAATQLAAQQTEAAARATEAADTASELARVKTLEAERAQSAAVKAEGRRRVAEQEARAQEKIATSREGAATALALLTTDPEEGVRQASKAYDSAPTTQAADALRKSLFESHLQSVLRGHESWPRAAA